MRPSRYIRPLVIMLGLAMPVTACVLATGALLTARSSGAGDAFGAAFLLIYFWGAVTGSAVSFLHSAMVSRSAATTPSRSALLGLGLGIVAGALTPTMFTGLLEPIAIGLGGLTGMLYGLLVEVLPYSPAGQAPRART